jgi:uncharacterized protein
METSSYRQLALSFALMAAGAAFMLSAAAQGFDDERTYRRAQQRDYFPFPFFGGDRFSPPAGFPFVRPGQAVDSSKAPPPRKAEAAATMILVIGDSFADWLGYGLEEAFADSPEVGILRRIKPNSGLVHYDARNDTLEWSQAVKETLAAEKASAIVIMLGLNDRVPLRERAPSHPTPAQGAGASAAETGGQQPSADGAPAPAAAEAARSSSATAAAADAQHPSPGASYDFHTDKWSDLYGKRTDEMIAALKTKGVPVLWVGLPAIRGPKATSDMSYLDEIYRARADRSGIIYVDVWDGFVDERGQFAARGPDFEGQIRQLRSGDGVYFVKAGAVKLAAYVQRELQRVLSNRVAPVALPGAEQQSSGKAGALGPRPAVGAVVPLNAAGREVGDLLGAGAPARGTSDPITTRVFSRGDPVAAPAGRADDFSWPRRSISATASTAVPDAEPPPAASTAAAPAKATTKTDSKKAVEARASDAKKPVEAKANDAKKSAGTNAGETKNQPAPDVAATRSRRSRADADGGPRPRASVGSR